ncbi:MAG: SDR family NAD(P)-dependent oxidoreductase [Rhodobacteraceae bacterium]|nr:SDR family NAD(P)-dependent oxidoreductase [Paracoccaceae bacterium]
MTKTVLMTGCSSGIGLDCALTIAKRNWRVFATCRQEQDCARLRDMGLESFVLDYSQSESIREGVGEALERTQGSLDAVFNNGAHGLLGAVEDLPRDALRSIFEVNFFGYHELTTLVLPIMRKQNHGRIINNSSILGFVGLPWRGAYNATKFALEGLSDTLRIELQGTGIHVSLIQPGPITSQIRQKTRPHFEKWIQWEQSHFADVYREKLIPRLYNPKDKKDPFELPASAVTKVLIHALESRYPRTHYRVTFPTHLFAALIRVLPVRAVDKLVSSQK